MPQIPNQQLPAYPNPPSERKGINWATVTLVSSVIIFILIIAVLGYWFFVIRPEVESQPPIQTTPTKQATPSAQPATKSAETDETSDWKTYTNKEVGFQIKYSPIWLISNNSTDNNCSKDQAFFAPDNNLLGKCASGFGGLISITRTPTGADISQYIPKENDPSYTNLKVEEIDSTKRIVKYSGVSTINNEAGDFRGTKIITYLVDLGNRTLIISYDQSKNWKDYSKEFEQMVSTLRFD